MSYSEITRAGVDAAPALEFPTKRLTISTTVQYRGRTFQVSAEGWTMDRLCDMLDEKFGAAPNGGNTPPAEPGIAPKCVIHGREMKQGKGGWYCPTKVGDGWCKERAKS